MYSYTYSYTKQQVSQTQVEDEEQILPIGNEKYC